MTTTSPRTTSLDTCLQGAAALGLPISVSAALAMVFACVLLRAVSFALSAPQKEACFAVEGTYDWCGLRQDFRALMSFGLGALLCGWARWKEMMNREANGEADPLERLQLFSYMM
mmetsp:Transcript_42077/g.78185  ORF Transcript_42077/g.78185 Transcript_42077/m.78185 type:complete len:115 (-) Transcript_42077:128-472(-)